MAHQLAGTQLTLRRALGFIAIVTGHGGLRYLRRQGAGVYARKRVDARGSIVTAS
jgi:hypothetical protein